MNLKKVVVLCGFAIVMMAAMQIVLAEEVAVAPIDQAVITSNQEILSQRDTDIQWAWGEVMNLDKLAKTITLKYLDYETDQEQELVLVVDEKTTFENIQDFNALKLKDTLSIDYLVGADNKNIAKNISSEKPEAVSFTPDAAQPTAQLETPVDSSLAVNDAPIPAGSVPVVQDPEQAVQGQVQ